jgi:hypothetical protein
LENVDALSGGSPVNRTDEPGFSAFAIESVILSSFEDFLTTGGTFSLRRNSPNIPPLLDDLAFVLIGGEGEDLVVSTTVATVVGDIASSSLSELPFW